MQQIARFSRWGRISTAVFVIPLVVYAVVLLASGEQVHPSPDGYYSYLFARSLVFDGDFNFTNDYALCTDEFDVGTDHGTGHPDNPYYVGPAVFWSPWLFVLRIVWTLFRGAQEAERASCGGWMTVLTMLVGPVAGALTVWLSYRTARLVVSERAAAATALFFAFTSPVFGYSTTIAQYSHVYLALCVAALTYIAFRAVTSELSPRAWYVVAAALAVAVLHRLPAVLYAVIPGAAALILLRDRAKGRWLATGSVVVGAAGGIALTLALYLYLYGSIFVTPQGRYYVHLSEPHPFLVLFGVQGGFFFWMPAAWFSIVGAFIALARWPVRVRLLAVACLAAAVAEVYVSSSVLDWGARWSLGARRLVPLTPFVIVFAAAAVERFLAWIPARVRWFDLAAAVAIGLALVNNVPATMRVPVRHTALTQADLYGAWSPFRPLWAFADRQIGDVALLPAEWYARYRYGLSPSGYREAIVSRFTLGLRNLEIESDPIRFGDPWVRDTSSGFAFGEQGARLPSGEARMVFAVEWPSVSHVAILAKTDKPVELRISRGRAGEAPFVKMNFSPTNEPVWIELDVTRPPVASGINEWTFQTSEPSNLTLLEMKLDDKALPVPVGNASTQRAAAHPQP